MNEALPRRLLLALPAVVAVLFLMLTSSRPVTAALDCADLVITDLTVTPTSPVKNLNATIDVTVHNQGTCEAIGFVVQWKSSFFAPTGPSASVAGLDAGDSTTLSFTYAFPTAGNFLTIAQVDSAFAVTEMVETNNTAILSVTVQDAGSDLVITDILFSPEPAVAGAPMQATVRVQNNGNTAAGEFRVEWKPSPFGATQSQQVNGLAAGATTDVVVDYTYALPGTFNTNARVDVLNSVRETNEFNNTLNQSLVVDPPLPDLDVTNVSIAPANPVAGLPAQLTATIENVGHAPANSFQVRWKPSLLGLPLTQQVNGPLNPGASVNVTFDYTYSIGGSFTGTITADSASRVFEVSEANNSEDFTVDVAGSDVDLTITSFDYTPANPIQGENVQFSVTIQNLGNSPATNFEVSVNPDSFEISTPSLQTLTQQVDSLAGGASQVLTFDFEYPLAGNYRAIAEVDAFADVFESNEANNKALANLVVAPGSIDLDITDFDLSTDLCAQAVGFGNACSPMLYFKGSAVTAEIEITNHGTFPAGSFVVQWLPDQEVGFGPTAVVPGLLPGDSTTVELTSSYSGEGPFTSLATVDLFNQVVEPCAGCEDNNLAAMSLMVLPRDTTVDIKIEDFFVHNDLDGSGAGEWWMYFLAFEPNSVCDVSEDFDDVDQQLDGALCEFFEKNPDGSGSVGSGPTLTMTLPESMPLVIAITGLEDDISCGILGCDVSFSFPGYAYHGWLPGDYQVSGTTRIHSEGGDCGGSSCFYADVSVTVTKGAPPPASVGSGGAAAASTSLASAQSEIVADALSIQTAGENASAEDGTGTGNTDTGSTTPVTEPDPPASTEPEPTIPWWWWFLGR